MKKDDRGFALVGVLVLSVGLLTVVSGLLIYASTTNKRAVMEEQRARAFYAAESGVNHVLALIREGVTLPDSPPPTNGIIPKDDPAVTSPSGTQPEYKVWLYTDPKDGQRKIVSQGEDGIALRNVSVAVAGGIATVGEGAIINVLWPNCAPKINQPNFGAQEEDNKDTISITKEGVYESISLKNKSRLEITVGGYVRVTGDIDLGNKPFVDISPASPLTLYSKDIIIGNSGGNDSDEGSINVNGPTTVCAQNVTIGKRADLNINADGPVTLSASTFSLDKRDGLKLSAKSNFTSWIKDGMVMEKDFSINDLGFASQDETTWPKFVIGKGLHIKQDVTLGGESRRPVLIFLDPASKEKVIIEKDVVIYGLIWAPTREVDIDPKAKVYGQIVSKNKLSEGIVVPNGKDYKTITLPWGSVADTRIKVGTYTTK